MGQIRFLGEDNISNLSAVQNLIAMGKAKGAKPLYLHADAKANLDLPGVKTHVLGPPTLRAVGRHQKMRSADDVEFWMLLGATGTRFTASGGAPFPGRAASTAPAFRTTPGGCATMSARPAPRRFSGSCAPSTSR